VRVFREAGLDLERVADRVEFLRVALTDGIHVGVRVVLVDRDELGSEAEPDDRHFHFLGHGRFSERTAIRVNRARARRHEKPRRNLEIFHSYPSLEDVVSTDGIEKINGALSDFGFRISDFAVKRRKAVALLVETSNAYARGLLAGIMAFVRQHKPW